MYLMRLASDQPASVNNQIRSGMVYGKGWVFFLWSQPQTQFQSYLSLLMAGLSVDAWKAARCDATQNMNLLHHQGKLLLVPCYLSIVCQA